MQSFIVEVPSFDHYGFIPFLGTRLDTRPLLVKSCTRRVTMSLFSEHAVIDVDTHITEPADLWTARIASKWHDLVPHVERIKGRDFWVINGKKGLIL